MWRWPARDIAFRSSRRESWLRYHHHRVYCPQLADAVCFFFFISFTSVCTDTGNEIYLSAYIGWTAAEKELNGFLQCHCGSNTETEQNKRITTSKPGDIWNRYLYTRTHTHTHKKRNRADETKWDDKGSQDLIIIWAIKENKLRGLRDTKQFTRQGLRQQRIGHKSRRVNCVPIHPLGRTVITDANIYKEQLSAKPYREVSINVQTHCRYSVLTSSLMGKCSDCDRWSSVRQ